MSAEKSASRAALVAGFAAIYLIWGSTYLGIRVAVETLPPFLMAAVRFLAAGAVMALFLASKGRFKANLHQWRDNALVGGFLLLGGTGLVCWAEQKVPSGITTLIVSVGPLFFVLFDWAALAFFRDGKRGARPNALTFVGLALGFAGLALLVGPDVVQQGAGHLDALSVVVLVIACTSWSFGSIYTRYTRDQAEPMTASAIQMLCGGGWLALVSLVMGEPWHFNAAAVSGRSLGALLYLIVVGSLVGYNTYIWLMKHSTPAKVSTYAYVNPIVAVFLGWLILHEPVSPRIFVAAAVIIAGVAIITIAKNKKKPAATPARPEPALAAAEPARESA